MNPELDRLKSAFLAIISHELRTPLTEIVAALCLLQEDYVGPLNDRQRQYVDIAKGAADRLDGLISDLIAFSQLQSEMMETRQELHPLSTLVARVTESLRPRAQFKELALSFSSVRDLPPILVDEALITRVVSNLVINAINFTPAKGQVNVSVNREPGFQTITVHDTGVGIPQEKKALLFDSFYQANGYLTRQVGGLGIGLAYAKRIVEAHKGKITFTSQEGQGSSFVVHLPFP